MFCFFGYLLAFKFSGNKSALFLLNLFLGNILFDAIVNAIVLSVSLLDCSCKCIHMQLIFVH